MVAVVVTVSSSSPPQLLISLIVRFISGLSNNGGGFDATQIGGVRKSSSTLAVAASNFGGKGICNFGLDRVALIFSDIMTGVLREGIVCDGRCRVNK